VPRVSVVVRSYNRLAALCELCERLLGQAHDSFEIVVIEQSTAVDPVASARLDGLARDARLRVLRSKPLGGPAARNLGALEARGDIIAFIDDDDLPVGPDYLSRLEAPFREDPGCMGVTGRHFWRGKETVSTGYRRRASRRCMRFSPVLRLPWTYPRHDQPVRGVDYVHGTGAACRRALLERVGGWDVDTPIEDETSMGIRAGRALAAGEYLAFDPRAVLERRMDLDGGLAKRRMTSGRHYQKFMTFVHHILGRYYPARVRALYPAYVVAGVAWTVDWIWHDSSAHDTVGKRLLGTLGFLAAAPVHAVRMLGEPLGKRPGAGELLSTQLAAR
jgi:glycosyltransferase involved in cell wall biosynthesis